MQIPGLDLEFESLQAPLPMGHARVTVEQWQAAALAVRDTGGRLIALWAGSAVQGAKGSGTRSPASVCAVYATLSGAFWLTLPLVQSDGQWGYPDVAEIFPAAGRMQRAVADLSGAQALGAKDTRPWLNHGAWPGDYFPALQDPDGLPLLASSELLDYPFVRVEGDGVHEIAVGPVHAGIIEPGHFRFSIVGEKV
jgi:hypothetical protein